MTPDERFRRYQDFQRYVGWSDDDARNVRAVATLLAPHLGPLVDDFYAEIERHPAARKVITGGPRQVERLKGSLIAWLGELLSGPYDQGYVERRLRVGQRHVAIGLDQAYTNVALSRLRSGLIAALAANWTGDQSGLVATIRSLNRLLDLDLAKIEDAYQAEYLAIQQRAERLATIGQVGSGVAHELRNPLNNIKTSAYYLLNAKNPTAEKRDEHLRRIQQQVQVADRVITTLSNYTKMPVPDLRPTDVRRVAEEVVTESFPPTNVRLVQD
jgi:signal transduction histidine kinase